MAESKFYQEINSHLKINSTWKPYIGKAKIKQNVNLWAGKWKKIISLDVDHVTLENNRDFKMSEIEEFRITTEFMQSKKDWGWYGW